MTQIHLFREISATYRKHGWQLKRVLMRPETAAELAVPGAGPATGAAAAAPPHFEGITAQRAEIDAMWFARASQAGREAWELRLAAETPYAIFELFEADEAEEDREDVRREMEARLREYAAGSSDDAPLNHRDPS